MLLLLQQFFSFAIIFPHFIQYKLYKHKLWNKLFETDFKKKKQTDLERTFTQQILVSEQWQ